MKDPLHPESTKATIGNFELSVITIIPYVSNEFVEHFLFTNLGLFGNSQNVKCISSSYSCWFYCARSVVTSAVCDWCTNILRCVKVLLSVVLSAIVFIHRTDHGSTVFIQFCWEFLTFFSGMLLSWVLPLTMFLLIWGFWLDLWILRLSPPPFYDHCCPQCHQSLQWIKYNIYYAMTYVLVQEK